MGLAIRNDPFNIWSTNTMFPSFILWVKIDIFTDQIVRVRKQEKKKIKLKENKARDLFVRKFFIETSFGIWRFLFHFVHRFFFCLNQRHFWNVWLSNGVLICAIIHNNHSSEYNISSPYVYIFYISWNCVFCRLWREEQQCVSGERIFKL